MDGPHAPADGPMPLAELAERLGERAEARLEGAVLAAARALHGLIGELRPTGEEFRAALEFLTEVGHATDERRQEWVLLSDVIGASSLIEDLNARRPPGATPSALAGPFYRADVPELPNGADLSRDGKGERLSVAGRVRAIDGAAVGGAVVEVWQANADGVYENQAPDQQPEFNLRGRLRADRDGRFDFLTVRPGRTRLPGDGPVGRLMARLGLGLERPAHIHFRVAAPGLEPLVTHIFDGDDARIDVDPLFGVRPELLARFQPRPGPAGAPRLHLDVTLTLCRRGAPAEGAA